MKYSLNYQRLRKGAPRPDDEGQAVRVTVDESGFALLPNVGDFVNLDGSIGDMASFNGRVRSRLFSYVQGKDSDAELDHCIINIVVEEMDVDWDQLIKE